jgi:small subunit ribosomal protein S20
MPITKSAKKALRQTHSRTERNKDRKLVLRRNIKIVEKAAADKNEKVFKESLSKTFKLTDKAVKQRLLHKNKAARIKSRLSKLVK